MKKIMSLILILICSISFLTGCEKDDKSDADVSKDDVIVSESTDNENSKEDQNEDNRYYVGGIDDPVKFEEMFNEVKKFVSEDNKEKVSEYILYPLRVNHDKSTREIKTPQEFIENYDNIFTKEVKEALLNQDVKDTFVNYQGVMVGNGEIWFGSSQDSSKYGIIAINN
ncbi:hypothetical protein [Tepidibacter hydrothermalis]|uniref:Lipoprotein n=1 Tax=Tepidibacter hydrothermalis TaxID=3036126 RepID=A0ABY8ED78_9FIRM|nr:hypothetical protein [Tepidibacter hydrothermalis]WFD09850.1 hypothetical protein P4S50_15840 [Tepidibacter hydrothermalis]